MKHLEDQFFEYAAGEMDPIQAEKFWAGLGASERAELNELKGMLQGLRELRDDVPECQMSTERLRYAIDRAGAKPKARFWKWHPWLPAAALGSLVAVGFLVQSVRPSGLPPVPEGRSIAELDGAIAGSGPIGSAPRYEMPPIGAGPTVAVAKPESTEVKPEPKPMAVAAVVPEEPAPVRARAENPPRRSKRRKPQRVIVVADARPVPNVANTLVSPLSSPEMVPMTRAGSGSAGADMEGTMATPVNATAKSSTQQVTVVAVDDQNSSVVQTATEVKKSNDVVIGS